MHHWVLAVFIKLYLQEYGCKKLEIKLHHLLKTIIEGLCWGVLEEGNKGLGQTAIAKKKKDPKKQYLWCHQISKIGKCSICCPPPHWSWRWHKKVGVKWEDSVSNVSIKMIMKPGD